MKNINYWVISPNVKNNNEVDDWRKFLSKYPLVCMGWSPGDKGGDYFHKEMNIDDVVIVAQRQSWNWNIYSLGMVSSNVFSNGNGIESNVWEEMPTESWYRKLSYWIPKPKIGTFNGYTGQIPPAIWKLTDEETINNINAMITNEKKNIELNAIIKLLMFNKNIILTGAPGTGKTYKTAEIAVALIDGSDKLPSNRTDLMKRYKELINAKQIAFTTFHQSLDYEEFIEGLKPEVDGSTKEMTYQMKDGIFKAICERAKEKRSMDSLNDAIEQFKEVCSESIIKVKNKSKTEFSVTYRGGKTFRVRSDNSEAEEGRDFPTNIEAIKKMYQGNEKGIYNKTYVWGILEYLKRQYQIETYREDNSDKKYLLIIDEINRGNISKIFGELITLLENDKRIGEENEITVTLPYSQETFGVPSNLFIIGTMNTADRSIGHIDYAIRRRFSFVSLKSDKNVISSYDKYDNGVKEKAESLFDGIKDFISANINADLDADDLMIGHSYFLCKGVDNLKMRLECEIIPLIEEYEKDGIIMLDRSVMKSKFEEWKALWS